ncbi:hypothetical protein [Allobaculum stercoricanis]|uniref:hypothetical protein n=1 Tax=Allobaculum stercoricanis TaxID=174709 RepID=UPI0023F348FB|nr:hypothetical protein [Allobaculum stercoricanis]
MDVLIIMCFGILAGRFLVPNRAKKENEFISLACTFLLILSMGATLGKDQNFMSNLSSLGLSSLLFFFIPTVLSILIVYVLTKKFMEKRDNSQEK